MAVMALPYIDAHAVLVASMLGRPVGTVTEQLSRADARLRAALGGQRP
jgi:DNA-directed RNA polymerase specialized sigma24 family protein